MHAALQHAIPQSSVAGRQPSGIAAYILAERTASKCCAEEQRRWPCNATHACTLIQSKSHPTCTDGGSWETKLNGRGTTLEKTLRRTCSSFRLRRRLMASAAQSRWLLQNLWSVQGGSLPRATDTPPAVYSRFSSPDGSPVRSWPPTPRSILSAYIQHARS